MVNPPPPGSSKSQARVSDPLGLDQTLAQPGDHAVFFYAPLRDGNPGGFLLKVTLTNGQELSFSLTPADQ